jgi:hypothetical protein
MIGDSDKKYPSLYHYKAEIELVGIVMIYLNLLNFEVLGLVGSFVHRKVAEYNLRVKLKNEMYYKEQNSYHFKFVYLSVKLLQ